MNSLKNILQNLFIPHERNNYRGKALQLDFLTYYLIFALFLTFGFKIVGNKSGEVLGYATDITIDKLYQLTNGVRQQNQLPTLTFNGQLATAAQKKASDMFAKNYWSHYGPDGTTPWDFILSSGYQYEFAGENLAKNFLFSQGVIDAWMASSSHKENILRKDYTEVGFAIVNGVLNGEETTLVVEMFGRPLLASEPEIRPIAVKAESPSETKPAISEKSVIIAQNSTPQYNKIRQFSFNSSFVFLTFLLLAFVMDLYFANRLHVVRINGKNLAHLIFIGFIFVGIFLLTKGAIL